MVPFEVHLYTSIWSLLSLSSTLLAAILMTYLYKFYEVSYPLNSALIAPSDPHAPFVFIEIFGISRNTFIRIRFDSAKHALKVDKVRNKLWPFNYTLVFLIIHSPLFLYLSLLMLMMMYVSFSMVFIELHHTLFCFWNVKNKNISLLWHV